MVLRPWAYAIWERLRSAIDERIKATETIINSYIARWVSSHRDLPPLLNQWGSEAQHARDGVSVRCCCAQTA